jgi:hypothetical protein
MIFQNNRGNFRPLLNLINRATLPYSFGAPMNAEVVRHGFFLVLRPA